jgi:hypothetical protein
MQHISRPLAAGLFLLAITAAGAHAQPQNPPPPAGGMQGFEFQQNQAGPAPAPAPGTRPLFHLFGVPVLLNAPVLAPSCTCATQLYAAAPAGGRNVPISPNLSENWMSSR